MCIAHYGNHAPLHKRLGAGIREEIRPCWHGSFNEALSRKSRSEAAFILCHFSNNVCRLVRVCVCASTSLCLQGNRGVFPIFFFSLLRAHASACLHGFGLPMRFMVQFKEAAVIYDPTPPPTPALFLMICEFIYLCVFFLCLPRCITLTPGSPTTLFFILFHPLCCHTLYRTIVSLPGVLHSPPFNLTSPGCV